MGRAATTCGRKGRYRRAQRGGKPKGAAPNGAKAKHPGGVRPALEGLKKLHELTLIRTDISGYRHAQIVKG